MPISSPCTLIPIDLQNPLERDILQKQRQACGWYSEPERLEKWRRAASNGTKSLFWITVPNNNIHHPVNDSLSQTHSSIKTPQTPSEAHIRAGHISLDSVTEHPDPDHILAHPSKTLLTISTFFILPLYQSRGLGRSAMTQIELLARTSPYGHPDCAAIAITSLSKRYVVDERWRDDYRSWTGNEPVSYEDWYAKMGYVKFKEEEYIRETSIDGEEFMLVEAFMKKMLV